MGEAGRVVVARCAVLGLRRDCSGHQCSFAAYRDFVSIARESSCGHHAESENDGEGRGASGGGQNDGSQRPDAYLTFDYLSRGPFSIVRANRARTLPMKPRASSLVAAAAAGLGLVFASGCTAETETDSKEGASGVGNGASDESGSSASEGTAGAPADDYDNEVSGAPEGAEGVWHTEIRENVTEEAFREECDEVEGMTEGCTRSAVGRTPAPASRGTTTLWSGPNTPVPATTPVLASVVFCPNERGR